MGRLFVAIAAVAFCCSSASAAVTPPKGDPDAIAFYKQEATLYNKIPGAEIMLDGYFSGHPIGKSVNFMWGHPPAAGFFPQQAKVVARLTDGKVVAYFAKLTAPKMREVRIVMSGSTVFLSSARCWNKAGAESSPFGTGDGFLFNDGNAHFLPLTKSGSSTTTTFTYDWGPGARAREIDTFSAGKRPTVTISIQVTGDQHMSIRKTVKPLVTSPVLPVPPPPARPLPKPLCNAR